MRLIPWPSGALTGLYNRASFERIFRQRWESFSVVYIEGNHLHEVNNREGHEAGDRQIRAIADALGRTFGDGASSFRPASARPGSGTMPPRSCETPSAKCTATSAATMKGRAST